MSVTIIVVPCYNEGERLDVERFRKFLNNSSNAEFLLVDDGSCDNTLELIEKMHGLFPSRVRLLKLSQNSGKAEAVRQGCVAAIAENCDYVGFWDADLATPLEEIPRFITVLEREPAIDCVIATRIPLLGHRIERRKYRRWLGRLFARVASFVIGLHVYDTQCGAKVFRVTPQLRKTLEIKFLSRWIFDVEILARMKSFHGELTIGRNWEAIYELPLDSWYEVAGSKLSARDFGKAFFELWQIFLTYRCSNLRFGKFLASNQASDLVKGHSTSKVDEN